MAADDSEIRVQVPLSKETVDKIDELAGRMNVGRGRMVAMLIEAGIEDNEWIIRMVTSSVMKPVRDAVHAWDRRRKGKGKAAAAEG